MATHIFKVGDEVHDPTYGVGRIVRAILVSGGTTALFIQFAKHSNILEFTRGGVFDTARLTPISQQATQQQTLKSMVENVRAQATIPSAAKDTTTWQSVLARIRSKMHFKENSHLVKDAYRRLSTAINRYQGKGIKPLESITSPEELIEVLVQIFPDEPWSIDAIINNFPQSKVPTLLKGKESIQPGTINESRTYYRATYQRLQNTGKLNPELLQFKHNIIQQHNPMPRVLSQGVGQGQGVLTETIAEMPQTAAVVERITRHIQPSETARTLGDVIDAIKSGARQGSGAYKLALRLEQAGVRDHVLAGRDDLFTFLVQFSQKEQIAMPGGMTSPIDMELLSFSEWLPKQLRFPGATFAERRDYTRPAEGFRSVQLDTFDTMRLQYGRTLQLHENALITPENLVDLARRETRLHRIEQARSTKLGQSIDDAIEHVTRAEVTFAGIHGYRLDDRITSLSHTIEEANALVAEHFGFKLTPTYQPSHYDEGLPTLSFAEVINDDYMSEHLSRVLGQHERFGGLASDIRETHALLRQAQEAVLSPALVMTEEMNHNIRRMARNAYEQIDAINRLGAVPEIIRGHTRLNELVQDETLGVFLENAVGFRLTNTGSTVSPRFRNIGDLLKNEEEFGRVVSALEPEARGNAIVRDLLGILTEHRTQVQEYERTHYLLGYHYATLQSISDFARVDVTTFDTSNPAGDQLSSFGFGMLRDETGQLSRSAVDVHLAGVQAKITRTQQHIQNLQARQEQLADAGIVPNLGSLEDDVAALREKERAYIQQSRHEQRRRVGGIVGEEYQKTEEEMRRYAGAVTDESGASELFEEALQQRSQIHSAIGLDFSASPETVSRRIALLGVPRAGGIAADESLRVAVSLAERNATRNDRELQLLRETYQAHQQHMASQTGQVAESVRKQQELLGQRMERVLNAGGDWWSAVSDLAGDALPQIAGVSPSDSIESLRTRYGTTARLLEKTHVTGGTESATNLIAVTLPTLTNLQLGGIKPGALLAGDLTVLHAGAVSDVRQFQKNIALGIDQLDRFRENVLRRALEQHDVTGQQLSFLHSMKNELEKLRVGLGDIDIMGSSALPGLSELSNIFGASRSIQEQLLNLVQLARPIDPFIAGKMRLFPEESSLSSVRASLFGRLSTQAQDVQKVLADLNGSIFENPLESALVISNTETEQAAAARSIVSAARFGAPGRISITSVHGKMQEISRESNEAASIIEEASSRVMKLAGKIDQSTFEDVEQNVRMRMLLAFDLAAQRQQSDRSIPVTRESLIDDIVSNVSGDLHTIIQQESDLGGRLSITKEITTEYAILQAASELGIPRERLYGATLERVKEHARAKGYGSQSLVSLSTTVFDEDGEAGVPLSERIVERRDGLDAVLDAVDAGRPVDYAKVVAREIGTSDVSFTPDLNNPEHVARMIDAGVFNNVQVTGVDPISGQRLNIEPVNTYGATRTPIFRDVSSGAHFSISGVAAREEDIPKIFTYQTRAYIDQQQQQISSRVMMLDASINDSTHTLQQLISDGAARENITAARAELEKLVVERNRLQQFMNPSQRVIGERIQPVMRGGVITFDRAGQQAGMESVVNAQELLARGGHVASVDVEHFRERVFSIGVTTADFNTGFEHQAGSLASQNIWVRLDEESANALREALKNPIAPYQQEANFFRKAVAGLSGDTGFQDYLRQRGVHYQSGENLPEWLRASRDLVTHEGLRTYQNYAELALEYIQQHGVDHSAAIQRLVEATEQAEFVVNHALHSVDRPLLQQMAQTQLFSTARTIDTLEVSNVLSGTAPSAEKLARTLTEHESTSDTRRQLLEVLPSQRADLARGLTLEREQMPAHLGFVSARTGDVYQISQVTAYTLTSGTREVEATLQRIASPEHKLVDGAQDVITITRASEEMLGTALNTIFTKVSGTTQEELLKEAQSFVEYRTMDLVWRRYRRNTTYDMLRDQHVADIVGRIADADDPMAQLGAERKSLHERMAGFFDEMTNAETPEAARAAAFDLDMHRRVLGRIDAVYSLGDQSLLQEQFAQMPEWFRANFQSTSVGQFYQGIYEQQRSGTLSTMEAKAQIESFWDEMEARGGVTRTQVSGDQRNLAEMHAEIEELNIRVNGRRQRINARVNLRTQGDFIRSIDELALSVNAQMLDSGMAPGAGELKDSIIGGLVEHAGLSTSGSIDAQMLEEIRRRMIENELSYYNLENVNQNIAGEIIRGREEARAHAQAIATPTPRPTEEVETFRERLVRIANAQRQDPITLGEEILKPLEMSAGESFVRGAGYEITRAAHNYGPVSLLIAGLALTTLGSIRPNIGLQKPEQENARDDDDTILPLTRKEYVPLSPQAAITEISNVFNIIVKGKIPNRTTNPSKLTEMVNRTVYSATGLPIQQQVDEYNMRRKADRTWIKDLQKRVY